MTDKDNAGPSWLSAGEVRGDGVVFILADIFPISWQTSLPFLLGMGSRWSDSWLALVFIISVLTHFYQADYKLHQPV